MNRFVYIVLFVILAGAIGLSACVAMPAAADPTATLPPPTATASPTVTPSATATQTPTASPTATFTPTPTATATRTPRPTNTPVPPTNTPTIPPIPESGFAEVYLMPEDGLAISDLLRQHAQLAHQMGLTPFVEFTASWCPPCQAIAEKLEAGNKRMVDAFQGTYIIRVDVDEWGWGEEGSELERLGFGFESIPIFFAVDENGVPNGDTVGGDAWGDNEPVFMAPPLKEFFQAHMK